MNTTVPLIAFGIIVGSAMMLDLGVFNRHAHIISIKEATIWTCVWIALAITFNAGLYFWNVWSGISQEVAKDIAMTFFTGYVLEKALSIDNVFVFVLILSYFRVLAEYQHKVLFWGIVGALIMRAIFIALGVTLVKEFHWVIYVLGGFLIFTAIKVAQKEEGDEIDPERNFCLKFCVRHLRVMPHYLGDKFFIFTDGEFWITPLFLVLVMVETTDLVFALDSIPAILGVTQDPFLIYTSNVFAILGLRALYFVVVGMMGKFHYLKFGIAAVLFFVGVKMFLPLIHETLPWITKEVSIPTSLIAIASMIGISLFASVIHKRRKKEKPLPF